ncbi:MAG: formimidoylglutamase [Bacteroidota bacterium]|nr:formimidoylglutamase [Bacteroidota bacterium]
MSIELLKPINEDIISYIKSSKIGSIGEKIQIHTSSLGLPDIELTDIAIIGISEIRNSFFESNDFNLSNFRKEFYELNFGKWKKSISDLGNLPNGESTKDTYHAITEICLFLREKNIITIIIGGSNDIIFPIFKSYNNFNKKINIVSIDNQFDLHQEEDLLSSRSYMNKIIIDDSSRLNDFTNLGYQRHLCSPNEIDLMEKLFFDYISLGDLIGDDKSAEPILRDAHIIGLDMKALSWVSSGDSECGNPNGIDSRLICILSRYSGISDKCRYFGLFELLNNSISTKLYAQIIWYFIEGVNSRFSEPIFSDDSGFIRYNVSVSGRDLIFIKSKESERWWLEITLSVESGGKRYLPCLESDYNSALNDNIPERWLRAVKRI